MNSITKLLYFFSTKNYIYNVGLLVLAFLSSLVTTLVSIRYQHLHERVSSDHDLSGPQKFHTHAVLRIGGIGTFLTLVICAWVAHSTLSLERDSSYFKSIYALYLPLRLA